MEALPDTNVLSEIGKDDGNPVVKAAVAEIPAANLYLSVLIVGEIAKGIALRTPGKKKQIPESWLIELETQFADRILDVDIETARIWGEMTAPKKRDRLVTRRATRPRIEPSRAIPIEAEVDQNAIAIEITSRCCPRESLGLKNA